MTRIALIIPTLALAAAVYAATTTHAAQPADAKASEAKAPAAKVNVAATFGNTVLSVYPDGRAQKIWLQPDGSWTGLSRRDHPLAGTWTVKGEKVCLRQSKPPTLPISFCEPFPEDPSKGIDAKDLTGTKIHLKLVKGHVEKAEG
ncbi:MAG TPA: hypothetical protein VFE18_07460 [Phenylobacterium sp.]|jgi:hypothetical protein|uniref:hypothetical protein n=1 Tax=Phenylobacterium sp. TaxID=1871053 RepID=UPI002D56C017|nr:hypothetical protein [Phenylobacterium sp.]HZZ67995.1 hypothetical protein [Phenylobacterium sp.]